MWRNERKGKYIFKNFPKRNPAQYESKKQTTDKVTHDISWFALGKKKKEKKNETVLLHSTPHYFAYNMYVSN